VSEPSADRRMLFTGDVTRLTRHLPLSFEVVFGGQWKRQWGWGGIGALPPSAMPDARSFDIIVTAISASPGTCPLAYHNRSDQDSS
jgi:hypothetical protein